MKWYKMLETIDDYEEGEEYAELPDEIIENYPGSFTITDDTNTASEDIYEL